MAANWTPRLRWALPVALATILLSGYFLGPRVAGADEAPELAPISAADLLVKAKSADVDGLSGEVKSSARLGLPELPRSSNGPAVSVQDLLAGDTTFKVWASDSGDVKLAFPTVTTETVVVKTGQDVFLYQSDKPKVTKLRLPDHAAHDGVAGAQADPRLASTPQQAAERFLSAVEPTTAVSVDGTARVAGRAAYELVLTPKSTTSLVGQVRLAVDAQNSAALRTQVFARGATTPAYEIAYTAVEFVRPAASTFVFTPPTGTTVDEKVLPRMGDSAPRTEGRTTPIMVGTGWDTVYVLPADQDRLVQLNAVPAGATVPVSGPFGSGRILKTALLNVVLLDDGRVAIGSTVESSLLAAIPAP